MNEWPHPSPEIRRFADLIGPERTLDLLENFAGQRIYVPRQVVGDTTLATALGVEAARIISAEYGGDYLKVPIAREWRVLVYKSRRMSYRDIAKKVGCGEDNVWRILNKNEATQAQLTLF